MISGMIRMTSDKERGKGRRKGGGLKALNPSKELKKKKQEIRINQRNKELQKRGFTRGNKIGKGRRLKGKAPGDRKQGGNLAILRWRMTVPKTQKKGSGREKKGQ